MAKSKTIDAQIARADDDGRVVARVGVEEDRRIDLALRPRHLNEFVGQQRTKEILGMSIEAAHGRAEVLDHVLFS